MRILVWHVDRFRCEITEKGRSPLVEEYDDPVIEVKEALVVFAAVEKADQSAPEAVAKRAAAELLELGQQVGCRRFVLHPFAHLFAELSRPKVAVHVMKELERALLAEECEVTRTPFGWFNKLDIQAKGHPLSRVARTITAE